MGTSGPYFLWQCPECFVLNSIENLHLTGVKCGNCQEYTFKDYQPIHYNLDTFGIKNYVRNCISYESLPSSSNDVCEGFTTSAFYRTSRNSVTSLSGQLSNFQNKSLSSLKSVSLPSLNTDWICAHCSFKNKESLSCYICEKEKMAMPQIFLNDDEMQEKQSNLNTLLDNSCQDCPVNKSPKRHSLSVYERVKYKVSRSLSNGSTIHKKYTEPRRPSSLLVDKSNIDFNTTDKNQNFNTVARDDSETWSCQRCTLDNSVESERCDICETPKKSYIPLSTSNAAQTSLVISVPKWDKSTVDAHKKKCSTNINPHLEHWQKPAYKRCQSEYLGNDINSLDVGEKIRMAESNILRNSANNLNLQLSCVSNRNPFTSYSYIGISEPNNKDSSFLSCQDIISSQPPSLNFNASSNTKNTIDFSQLQSSLERMWTCIKCSYAYNHLWCDTCEICKSARTPPSLTKPSLITVTKDTSHFLVEKPDTNESIHTMHIDDIKLVPLSMTSDTKWTCRKCTLVNLASDVACIACGGSKLRSTSLVNDLTLRKGEFWTCQYCTLKNPLNVQICQVCKSQNKLLLNVPLKTTSPRSPSHKHGKQKLLQAVGGAIPKQKSVVRRNSAGSATNRSLSKQKAALFTEYRASENTEIQSELKWQCVHCTYENPILSLSCEMCQSPRSSSPRITNIPQSLNNPSQQNKCISKSKLESELMEDLRFVEEKEAITEWDRIIKYCTENGEPFVDDSFPPAPKSLYYNPNDIKDNHVVQWLRPHQINNESDSKMNWVVFRTPLPSDISQESRKSLDSNGCGEIICD